MQSELAKWSSLVTAMWWVAVLVLLVGVGIAVWLLLADGGGRRSASSAPLW